MRHLFFSIDGEHGLCSCFFTLSESYSGELIFEQGPCRNWLRLQPSPKSRTLSPGNLAWLQSIAEHLDGDTEQLTRDLIPTRLIDVRATATTDCRLVVTDSGTSLTDTRYLALSYCWGTEEQSKAQLTTQQATLRQLQSGFTLAEASPVLRDAVEVARALGIQYLWVDAVCIAQDDQLDWEREAAKMALIYRHAWLTVCVLNTDSCVEHFLKRPSQYSTPICFSFRLRSGIDGAYWVQWHTTHETDPPSHSHIGADFKCRWMTRGWTLQEFVLSRNTLLFEKYKMHYRNIEWTISEGSDVRHTHAYGYPLFETETLSESDNSSISGWNFYLARASIRNLTKPMDKLPSLTGLARVVTQDCPQQYFAGVRKGLEHRDLMWVQQSFLFGPPTGGNTMTAVIDHLENQQPYIAPSWSWASRTSRIEHYLQALPLQLGIVYEVEKEYESIEAYTLASGANPFGKVSGGAMTISGTIIPIHSQQLRSFDDDPLQAWMASIETQMTAVIVLDGYFHDGEQPSQGLSLVLLGSCVPVYNKDSKALYDDCWAQHFGQAEADDEFGDMSDPPSNQGGSRTPEDFEDMSYTGSSEGRGRIPGSIRAYDDSEGGEAGTDREEGETGTGDEDEKADRDSEDRESSTDGEDEEDGEGSTGSRDSECFFGDRAAYGIVVYPAKGQQGKYFRVGVWASQDGLDYLRSQEPKTVEIV